ncbi:hypothetical protein OG259_38105 [Streptomyces sp. NBC_00250]|uniref:hypothetical protein n=1 Tax=Streptomyces sp. NBC_00250 TaxID=2903641 RepID=UPI002E2841E6|nr:hypothetical protein [Streptomyces sp. NBC_00250]
MSPRIRNGITGTATSPLPSASPDLEVTVEYGLSDYIVHAALPDGSSMIISPSQEPPTKDHESWTVIRHREAGPAVYEVIYDSEPGGPHAQHGGSIPSLLAAVDARLDQLGVPPRPEQQRSSRERAADAAHPDKARSPVEQTALPTSASPRVSAALAPLPSAGPRTVRTRLATDPPPRPVLPPARPSTAPGR